MQPDGFTGEITEETAVAIWFKLSDLSNLAEASQKAQCAVDSKHVMLKHNQSLSFLSRDLFLFPFKAYFANQKIITFQE